MHLHQAFSGVGGSLGLAFPTLACRSVYPSNTKPVGVEGMFIWPTGGQHLFFELGDAPLI
jgi:hypothetical protein